MHDHALPERSIAKAVASPILLIGSDKLRLEAAQCHHISRLYHRQTILLYIGLLHSCFPQGPVSKPYHILEPEIHAKGTVKHQYDLHGHVLKPRLQASLFGLPEGNHSKLGMIRSIPNMSLPGKATPQSTTKICSSHSINVILDPIRSNPPIGMIFTFFLFLPRSAKVTPLLPQFPGQTHPTV